MTYKYKDHTVIEVITIMTCIKDSSSSISHKHNIPATPVPTTGADLCIWQWVPWNPLKCGLKGNYVLVFSYKPTSLLPRNPLMFNTIKSPRECYLKRKKNRAQKSQRNILQTNTCSSKTWVWKSILSYCLSSSVSPTWKR